MTRTKEELYRDYIKEVKRQLADARRQVDRIAKLEEVSNYTFEEWQAFLNYQSYEECMKRTKTI